MWVQTGYREGITAGKTSTLQGGFDQGFNEVGALLGRQVGLLRGQVAALLLLTSSSPSNHSSNTTTRKGAGVSRNRGTGSTTSLPILGKERVEEAKDELKQLAKELDGITLAKLAEPDYEVLEHEMEHSDESAVEIGIKRETEGEKKEREQILRNLKERLQAVREVLGLKRLEE